ncbi:MAG: 4-alpha-glucanotransferase [Opitutaceae bacterium]
MALRSSDPLLSWLDHRAAGLLLHPTSLPGAQGIGTLGESVDAVLRFLQAAGLRYWQMCPLGPTGFGDSPYQCFSSFAGNPYLIDVLPLHAAGWLTHKELESLRELPETSVDFGGLYQRKLPLLFQVWERWRRQGRSPLPGGGFDAFRREQAAWLEAYVLFAALKEEQSGRPWWEWPTGLRSFASAQRNSARQRLEPRMEAHAFLQYLFFSQWRRVRTQAAAAGIEIIGDIPIFTALDSADVWAHPELFQLDPRTARPTAVAGVPPDYFSADGQLWGNPLYDWPVHAASGYGWWLDRLRAAFAFADVVRIDHFRGFEAYWSVPASAATARTGRWIEGPGLSFFSAVRTALPGARLIAEDLGLLTPETTALREATGLPGMAVLQFAFGGDAQNPYLPHNLHPNCVIYPGTHDNDTALGWYQTSDESIRDHVRRYLRISGREIGWDLIRCAYASVASLAVIPLQDLLSLGAEGRFNTPGQAAGNWGWRYRSEQLERLERDSAGYLRELAGLHGRLRTTPAKPGRG